MSDFDGNRWFCAHCKQPSSHQGCYGARPIHGKEQPCLKAGYKDRDGDRWGFYCKPGHTCHE